MKHWHICQTFNSLFSFACSRRRVTHHAGANMPILHATSRVCKFYTCPIILPPLPSPPLIPPLLFVPSLFSHMLVHSHLTLSSSRSRKQRCPAKGNCNRDPAESDRVWQHWRPPSSRPSDPSPQQAHEGLNRSFSSQSNRGVQDETWM